VVAHTFNPSTWETEAGGFLSSRPSGLQSEFQDSQGYTEKNCFEKKIKTKTKTKNTKQLSVTPVQGDLTPSLVFGHTSKKLTPKSKFPSVL
jgi:hypothetical protein